jgi:hypothetical protein
VVGGRDAARQPADRRQPPRADVRRRGGRARAHPARADDGIGHGHRATALQRAPGAGDPRVARARAARLDPRGASGNHDGLHAARGRARRPTSTKATRGTAGSRSSPKAASRARRC